MQQRFVPGLAPLSGPSGLDPAVSSALAAAAEDARRLGHHYVTPEHLVLALAEQPDELAGRALQALGVSPEQIRMRIVEHLGTAPPRPDASLGIAPETKRLLEHARKLATGLGHRCARTEHVLLAAVSPTLKGPAGDALAAFGAEASRVWDQLAAMLDMEAPELAARIRKRRRIRR